MFRDISDVLAVLVSSWIVGPFYGINLILASLTLYLLSRRGFKQGSNIILVVMVVAQLLICTGHTVTLVVQLVRGFASPSRLTYLANLAVPERVAQEALYLINSQIGDWFMSWRVFVVWQGNWLLTAPFILVNVVLFIFASVGLANFARLQPLESVFTDSVRIWFIPAVAMSLAVQLGGTFLIAWRSWSTPMVVVSGMKHKRFDFVKLLCVIVDSGVLYTCTTVILLAFFLSQTNSAQLLFAILGQLSATVPMMIIIRECYKAALAAKKSYIQGSLLVSDRNGQSSPREVALLAGRATPDTVIIDIMQATHLDPLASHKPKIIEMYHGTPIGRGTPMSGLEHV